MEIPIPPQSNTRVSVMLLLLQFTIQKIFRFRLVD